MADPVAGLPRFETLADDPDPDVAGIVRENEKGPAETGTSGRLRSGHQGAGDDGPQHLPAPLVVGLVVGGGRGVGRADR